MEQETENKLIYAADILRLMRTTPESIKIGIHNQRKIKLVAENLVNFSQRDRRKRTGIKPLARKKINSDGRKNHHENPNSIYKTMETVIINNIIYYKCMNKNCNFKHTYKQAAIQHSKKFMEEKKLYSGNEDDFVNSFISNRCPLNI